MEHAKQGIAEVKSGNEDMVACSYKIHDSIDLRFVRHYAWSDDDIYLFPSGGLQRIAVAALFSFADGMEFVVIGRGACIDSDPRVGKDIFQVIICNICPIRN